DLRELRVEDGQVLAPGGPIGAVEEFLVEPIECTRVYHHRPTQSLDQAGQGDAHVTFAFAAQRAVVDVDVELGLARVVQVAAAQAKACAGFRAARTTSSD